MKTTFYAGEREKNGLRERGGRREEEFPKAESQRQTSTHATKKTERERGRNVAAPAAEGKEGHQ